ncbi:MAG: hypothetical protein HZB25_04955 [Candidatus Eisenbacteria bacterium]|nr:hypothetical protein [Candidatus Eisenbacteria bacterium]
MKCILGLCLAALLVSAGVAQAVEIGVGAFGGASYPVIMQDAGRGTTYGVRMPIKGGFPLTFEPFFQLYKMGEGKQTVDDTVQVTRAAFDGTTFGANVILGSPMGMGLKFFPYGGLNFTKLTRTASEDISEMGFNFGLGLGLGLNEKLSIIARADANMVKTGETSRKFGNVLVGLNYGLIGPAKGGRP